MKMLIFQHQINNEKENQLCHHSDVRTITMKEVITSASGWTIQNITIFQALILKNTAAMRVTIPVVRITEDNYFSQIY